jgi:prepilin-type N-terminal cleavage/methylation domain-containing protein
VSSIFRIRAGGFSLLELVVAMGVLTIVAATGVSLLRRTGHDQNAAASAVVANLRLARGSAIAHGVHYRVRITAASAYALERMRLQAGSWVLDTTERSTALPLTLAFDNSVGSAFEFDSRGRVVQLSSTATVTVRNTRNNALRVLSIWPSGQIVDG